MVECYYNTKDLLVLKRAFLATAGAQIDEKRGTIRLDVGDVDGQTFSAATSDESAAEFENCSEFEMITLHDEVADSAKLLNDYVFVMETRLAVC